MLNRLVVPLRFLAGRHNKMAARVLAAALIAWVVGIAPTSACAQDAGPNTEAEWKAFQKVRHAFGRGRSDKSASARVDRALAARSAASAARSFYLLHPDSPHAAEAKKEELILRLQAILPNDVQFEKETRESIAAYRGDPAFPTADRFEVALLADVSAIPAKSATGLSKSDPQEKIADKLLSEFPGLPQACYHYIAVARAANASTAERMAARLLGIAEAPPEARADAQELLDRRQLLGKPLALDVADADGKALAMAAGKPTVIYFWSPTDAAPSFGDLQSNKSVLRANVRVLLVPVSGTEEQLKAAKEKSAALGQFGTMTDATSASLAALKMRRLPWVCVLDRDGTLAGFGPPDQLKNLLAGVH